MIENRVPKDIRKLKGKAVGPFTFRQVICGIIAGAVDIEVYSKILKPLNVSDDVSIFIIVLCSMGILIFTKEVYGMKMEVFLTTVLYKNIFFPTKRKVDCDLRPNNEKLSASDIRKINKEYQQRIKENPEWKMYE